MLKDIDRQIVSILFQVFSYFTNAVQNEWIF